MTKDNFFDVFWKRLLPIPWLVLLCSFLLSGMTNVILAPNHLLVVHELLELISIILGFIIFYITWYGTSSNNSSWVTITSLTVLTTAILEGVHLLSYPGIDTGQVTGDHVWATTWAVSRLTWSFGMLSASFLPSSLNGQSFLPNRTLLYCSLALVTVIIANIVFSYDPSPYMSINAYNSPLAKYSQLVALIADLTSLFILFRNRTEYVGRLPHLAVFFGLSADLAFCLAIHTPFSINLAGHIMKIIANFYVLRSIYILVIQKPYDEIIKLKEDMEELADKNAKLYVESEHQRNLVEDILAKIGVILSSQLDVKETLEAIVNITADMMRVRQSAIALFTNDCSSLQIAATCGISAPPEVIPLTNSLSKRACELKEALFIDDLTLHPEIFRPQLIFTTVRSIICAPLVNDHDIIGVIEAYSSEKSSFTERDALLLKALAYHAGAAISSAKLYEQTINRLDEEKFLLKIAQTSASTIDADLIIENCTVHAATALRSDIAIGLLSSGPSRDRLVTKYAVGLTLKSMSFEISSLPMLGDLISGPSPQILYANQLPILKELTSGYASSPVMLMPLPMDTQLLGLIILMWNRSTAADQLRHSSYPSLLAQQIALGLEKAQLYNQIKAMALSDGLTGLANRRNFDMFLATELRRATSLKRPVSLIMLDLDKFKSFNDNYGHPTGDILLTHIGSLLQKSIRSIDFPARYGGEEFAIILPECNINEAVSIAEKIRQDIENALFPDTSGEKTARITASLGVATFDCTISPATTDNSSLISIADQALYKAKKQGRNQVVSASVI